MKKRRSIPEHFSRNAARQAQTRYLRVKKTERARAEESRMEAGGVSRWCFLVALNERYGIDAARLERVTDAARVVLERFTTNRRAVGMERAKKKLEEELGGALPDGFLMPINKPPKNNRDWVTLGQRREAAEVAVKCYALGAKKALGFDAEHLQETVKATEQALKEFGQWAEGGDCLGCAMLASRIAAIMREPVETDGSGADGPIFGETPS